MVGCSSLSSARPPAHPSPVTLLVFSAVAEDNNRIVETWLGQGAANRIMRV